MLAISTILFYILATRCDKREPITITSNPSYPEMSLDTLIAEADLIVIGTPDTIYPSRWNTVGGKLPDGITVRTITPDRVIFTDANFRVDQVIKGSTNEGMLRIRSLGGIVGQDQMIVSGVANLETGKEYLLFLGKDIVGSTTNIEPGHYFVRGGLQGLYQVSDSKAKSVKDEWQLEELITYIQNLPTETPTP